MINDLSTKKLILALLYARGKEGELNEPIVGITRLEKMIFLLTEKKHRDLFNKFEYGRNRFGPYSFKLADQIENLYDLKLVKKTKEEKQSSADELNYYGDITIPFKFELTKYGKLIAKDIFEKLDENEQQELNFLKKKFNSKSLHALLSYVYNTIDKEWLEKSEIRDQYVLH